MMGCASSGRVAVGSGSAGVGWAASVGVVGVFSDGCWGCAVLMVVSVGAGGVDCPPPESQAFKSIRASSPSMGVRRILLVTKCLLTLGCWLRQALFPSCVWN